MRASIRLLVAALALSVAAVACGDDDGGDVLASSQASTDGDTATSDAAAADDAVADDSMADDSTESSVAMSGDSDSEWCRRIREIRDSDEPSPLDLSFTGFDPATLEAQFTTNLGVMQEWADGAPPEIDDQVDTMLQAYTTFVDLASEAEWNMVALGTDPEFIETFDDPAIEQAANDIDAYSRDVCGVDFAEIQDVPSTSTGGGEADDLVTAVLDAMDLPTEMLTTEQAACMSEQLTPAFSDGVPSGPDGLSTDQSAAIGVAMAVCGFG